MNRIARRDFNVRIQQLYKDLSQTAGEIGRDDLVSTQDMPADSPRARDSLATGAGYEQVDLDE